MSTSRQADAKTKDALHAKRILVFIDKFTFKLLYHNLLSVEYVDTLLYWFSVEACTVDVVPNVVCSSFVGYFAYLGLLNIASECPKHYV